MDDRGNDGNRGSVGLNSVERVDFRPCTLIVFKRESGVAVCQQRAVISRIRSSREEYVKEVVRKRLFVALPPRCSAASASSRVGTLTGMRATPRVSDAKAQSRGSATATVGWRGCRLLVEAGLRSYAVSFHEVLPDAEFDSAREPRLAALLLSTASAFLVRPTAICLAASAPSA